MRQSRKTLVPASAEARKTWAPFGNWQFSRFPGCYTIGDSPSTEQVPFTKLVRYKTAIPSGSPKESRRKLRSSACTASASHRHDAIAAASAAGRRPPKHRPSARRSRAERMAASPADSVPPLHEVRAGNSTGQTAGGTLQSRSPTTPVRRVPCISPPPGKPGGGLMCSCSTIDVACAKREMGLEPTTFSLGS